MSVPSSYITLDKSIPSRSGLYANDLPGITLSLFDELASEDREDYLDFWNTIYGRAWINLVNDVQTLMADKFHIDMKLLTKESSKFQNVYNASTNQAGIKIKFEMPKYAKIHILSIAFHSAEAYASPPVTIGIYDNSDNYMTLIEEISHVASEGLNTINVDKDYEVEDEMFIGYDPQTFSFLKTINKYYTTDQFDDKLSCTFDYSGYNGGIYQINGGGLNVKFNIHCSIEKFITENINLFKMALWYRLGVELMIERRLSDKFNRWTTLTEERATELMGIYQGEYDPKLKNSVKNLRVTEDVTCFLCKSAVSASIQLP